MNLSNVSNVHEKGLEFLITIQKFGLYMKVILFSLFLVHRAMYLKIFLPPMPTTVNMEAQIAAKTVALLG